MERKGTGEQIQFLSHHRNSLKFNYGDVDVTQDVLL